MQKRLLALGLALSLAVPMAAFGANVKIGVINSIIGASIAPTIVTLGSWAMGGEQHLAASLAITGAVTALISMVGYMIAMRNAPRSATHFD